MCAAGYTIRRFFALRRVLCTLLLLIFPFSVQGQDPAAPVHSYRETVGNASTYFSWRLEQTEQQRIISVQEKNTTFVISCSDTGETRRYQVKDSDNNHDILAERQDDELKISGIRQGKAYDKTVKIDKRPWYQALSYSLRTFLESEDKAMTFWTIRNDTFEVTSLQAEKEGEEEVLVNGRKMNAHKVVLRAEGIYASFWHGTYWYRKGDMLFLMYRSVHGLPGTPETVVELIEEATVQEKFLFTDGQ
jgi:hypothetical protein